VRVVVTDSGGAILRVCMVANQATALLQLGPDGAAIYALPDDAGLIDDAALVVTAGVLTLKPGADPATQYAGLAVTLIPPSA
jgi:hypothetical protein